MTLTKNKPSKKILNYFIDFVLIAAFFVGVYFVSNYFYQRYVTHQEEVATTQLAKKVVKVNKKRSAAKTNKMPSEGNINIDWNKLKSINPKIKAWIYIPGTNINYAVLQGSDNSFYLHHNEYDQPSISGQIFFDYRNAPDFSDKNTFIYGHYMYDGTRFADLTKYFDSTFYNAHRHVYVYTQTKKYMGTVFAVQSNSGLSKAHTLSFKNNNDMTDYIEYLKSRSVVKNTIPTKDISKILTLWTCTEKPSTGDAGQTIDINKARTFVSVSLKEVN